MTAHEHLFFHCSGCGEDLECPAERAGKKVRCPCCGKVVKVPPHQPGATAVPPDRRGFVCPLVLTSVLAATFVLKLHNLDHTALTRWDEAHHAVVARNVLKHPFEPTLIDVPYAPYNWKDWGENHVWLHKPILPFWQVALCFAALGVNAFALRLPAAVLSTGAAWLTYLIGKELFDRPTALAAAALQAANPFVVMLVQGYQFADTVDVALLFWVEAGVYFLTRALRTGAWSDVLLAGLAQGLAWLCKSYLAAIVLGLAIAAWLLPACRLTRTGDRRITLTHVLGLLGATLLTVAPWTVYCAAKYPNELQHEHVQTWRHLYDNVETWGAPWDRVAFDYLVAIHGVFYTPSLMAAAVLAGKAVRRRPLGLWLTYAWAAGVVTPHLLAVSKTPSATVIALPAFSLLIGHLVAEAWRGERWPLAGLTAVLAASVIFPGAVHAPGHGYPNSRAFGAVMRQSWWVVGHVVGALALAAVVVGGWEIVARRPGGTLGRSARRAALAFCACALAWLAFRTVGAAWRVTCAAVNDPACVDVGRFARSRLPANAVLLCEEPAGGEHLTTLFYADRTCYALKGGVPDVMARRVLRAGGIPYVVSRRPLPLPPVYASGGRGPTVYLWHE